MAKNTGQPAEGLGRAIQLRRVELGLKRRDLALRSELSYPYISEIENGQKEPSAKALRQLAEALELSPSDLITVADRLSDDSDSSSVLVESDALRRNTDWEVTQSVAPGVLHDMAAAPQFFSLQQSVPTSVPPVAPVDGVLERWLSETVTRLVRLELSRWAQTELPEIVRLQVEDAIRRRRDT